MVPAETDVLCEGCGYTLNGLPETGNCPECGRPIPESVGTHRRLSSFEATGSLRSFLDTTLDVLLRPTAFYSALRARQDTVRSVTFTNLHRLIASALFALAAFGHLLWILDTSLGGIDRPLWLDLIALAGAFLIILPLMIGVTALASWLSAIEAKYWGMRLPRPIVRRAMRFHAASYLPVGLLAVAIVWGFRAAMLNRLIPPEKVTWYLYTLCAAVILSAGYLFRMYWIAMKGMMYANR